MNQEQDDCLRMAYDHLTDAQNFIEAGWVFPHELVQRLEEVKHELHEQIKKGVSNGCTHA